MISIIKYLFELDENMRQKFSDKIGLIEIKTTKNCFVYLFFNCTDSTVFIIDFYPLHSDQTIETMPKNVNFPIGDFNYDRDIKDFKDFLTKDLEIGKSFISSELGKDNKLLTSTYKIGKYSAIGNLLSGYDAIQKWDKINFQFTTDIFSGTFIVTGKTSWFKNEGFIKRIK